MVAAEGSSVYYLVIAKRWLLIREAQDVLSLPNALY